MGSYKVINSPINDSHPLASIIVWFTLTGVVVLLLFVLTLPLEARDVLILAMAGLILAVSIKKFALAWVAFVLFLPIVFLMTGMFGQAKINGERVFLVIFVTIFLFLPKPQKFWPMLRKHPVFWGLVFFVLANLISAIVSGQIESVFRALTFTEPLALFILSYYFVRRRPDNWKTLLWAIGASGAFVILLGLLEIIFQKSMVEILGIKNVIFEMEKVQFYFSENRFGLGGRISSTLLQPVYAGLYFSIYLITLIYFIVIYKKPFRKWLNILIPVGLMMIILTGARGPILSLGAALLAFIFLTIRKYKALGIVIIGLGVSAILITYAIPGFQTYILSSFDFTNRESANLSQRINVTLGLFEFFKINPVFGYGPGIIQKAAFLGISEFVGLGGLENQYATVLADGGLVAGIAFLVFIYGIFALAIKAYRSKKSEIKNAGRMMLVLAIFYFTVTISVNAISSVGGFLFVIIAGGLAGLCDVLVKDKK